VFVGGENVAIEGAGPGEHARRSEQWGTAGIMGMGFYLVMVLDGFSWSFCALWFVIVGSEWGSWGRGFDVEVVLDLNAPAIVWLGRCVSRSCGGGYRWCWLGGYLRVVEVGLGWGSYQGVPPELEARRR